ncbi:MAG TPA: hypothetical protein VLZ06_09225 [Solirubrobacteraceae bacterium]|nr:hypothetical protein [Solirubrobacteraceae bacterium]
MKAPFLVYELEQDQPSWGRRDRWSSCEADPSLPARLKANPLGCFIAETAAEACSQAAKVEQKAGNFLAIPGDFYKIDFTAAPDADVLTKLGEPPKKHPFYCCYGHPFCEQHPRKSDKRDDTDEPREPNATEGLMALAERSPRKPRAKRKD